MSTARWRIEDFTGTGKGYLQLQFDGERVCDFFPFAPNSIEHVIRQQADLICATMNEAEELRRLVADRAVSSELIGIRVRNTYTQ